MINVNLSLMNPWSDLFRPVLSWDKKLPKNKAVEIEVYRSNTIIAFEARLRHREDHAGLTVGLGLVSYTLRAQFYDTRHWNYDKKVWQLYEENLKGKYGSE